MWFNPDVPAVVNFLLGFQAGLHPSINFDVELKKATVERGWELGSLAPWRQMQEKGFDEATVIAEMLTIYNLAWDKIMSQETQDRSKNQ